MRVVTISGLDGSGKSTQIDMLRSRLESTGESVYAFHAIQFSVAQRMREVLRRLRGRAPRADGEEGGAVTSAGRGAIAFRKAALRVDLFRYRSLLRRLRRAGVSTVLSDRYFYDSLVNIAYLEHESRPARVRVPRPDCAVYVRVRPDVIVQRSRVPEQGVGYLEAKFALYDALAEQRSLAVVDGEQATDAVLGAILAAIDK